MPIDPSVLAQLAAVYARDMTSIRGRRIQRLVKREFAGAEQVQLVDVAPHRRAVLGRSAQGAACLVSDGRGPRATVFQWLHGAREATACHFDLLKDSLPLSGVARLASSELPAWLPLDDAATPESATPGRVVAVHRESSHAFSKTTVPSIELVAGHGVRDDAHFGITVQHRSRVAKDPTQPNLRQVHLLHEELFAEVAGRGLQVSPGAMGENVTTRGIDLLALGAGTRLRIGASAVVEVTGLRNPCSQIQRFRPGLLAAVLGRDETRGPVRKAGIMAVVLQGGVVHPDDPIDIVHAPPDYRPLAPV